MRFAGFALLAAIAISAVACANQAPPPPPAITVSQQLIQSTPPPDISTPVPVVHAKTVPGGGRPDPFVALYGPPSAASSSTKPVSVSAFPKIPTLPGFQTGPGGTIKSVWDGVALTGIVRGAAYTAILQVGASSYIVHEGQDVAGQYRVATIGPDFVTLEYTGTPRTERTFSLGG